MTEYEHHDEMKQEQITCDFIIVGQGIAGSILAHFLLQQHKKILVIDQHNPNSASNIAAGVVNPITGRKMVKSWMIDEVMPFAKSTYKELETLLHTSFFYEEDIFKLFTSKEDVDIWNRKIEDDEYKDYLGEIVESIDNNITANYGIGIIKQCCWMDVPVFIKAYRNYLKEQQILREEIFDISDIIVTDKIQYKNISASKIIFCEGYKAFQNPYFNFIPFSLAKGEQFVVHIPNLHSNKIINKNIFIIPKKNNDYTVGSTFIWNDVTETVTDEGRKEIDDKLSKMVNCNYQRIEEKAGIRPTMKDRRPVLGQHPNHSNVYIFNGFGTKGVSLAPYFANHLTNHIEYNFNILEDVSINRFLKYLNNR